MQKYLYQLIKGLTAAEKRHFDLWTGRYGEDKQYLILYKEITSMLGEASFQDHDDPDQMLDEKILLTRLEAKGMDRASFQDSTSYLYDLLLDSLRAQQKKESHEYRIKVTLQEAKVLERRGMLEAAMEKYQLALKDAEKIQHFTSIIEALKGIVVLGSQFDPKNYVQSLRDHLNVLEEMSRKQIEESMLFSLNYQSFSLVRTQKNFNDTERKEYMDGISQSIEGVTPPPQHFFPKIFWHSTKASLAILNKEPHVVRDNYHAIVEIWESPANKHLKSAYLSSFIIFLGNYLAYCISTGDYDSFNKYIQILESVKPKHLDGKAEYYQTLNYVKHLFFLNSGQLESADKMVPEIEQVLTQYAHKINQARKRTFRYNMMLVSFGLLKYEDALDHCRHLYPKSPHREDLAIVAKLFELIIQYKMRDHAALDTRIKSLTENLKYNENLHDFERIVLRYLSRLIKTQQTFSLQPEEEKVEALNVFTAFQEDLNQLRHNTEVKIPNGFEAILLWITSEVEGKSFVDLLSKKK